jgi:putative phosphoesterase
MERIALVSDIHSNVHALEVFMNYIDNKSKVSLILNMGDFIQIGPNPVEVYDIIMNDSRFINIMGNGEYMFFDKEIMKRYEKESRHQDWVINQLGNDRMERLKQVPLQRIVEIEDKKFLMVHTRINSVIEFPLLYEKKTLEEFVADYDEDVDYVLIGHTHFPLYAVHWNWKPILNPGSLGCSKEGIARFAIVELDDGLVNITYKQLKYDKEKVIRDYRMNSVPYSEKFIDMFY